MAKSTTTDRVSLAAAALVGLEAIGIAALAGWEILAMITGDTAVLPSALALLVLTVVGAVIVGVFAVAIARGASWGRSGAVVVQLMLLAVALGAVTGNYATPLLALILAVPAIITLVLVFQSSRRAAPQREPGDAASAADADSANAAAADADSANAASANDGPGASAGPAA